MNTNIYTFDFSNNYNQYNNTYAFEEPVDINWVANGLNEEVEHEHQERASTFAEEGSVDLENFDSLETAEPVTLDNLEQNVKKEINMKGIDHALNVCLKSKTSEKKKVQKKIRNKQTKSKDQIRRLQEELEKNPHRWTKQERIRIANDIGLTQIQVYKWYYDNTTGKTTPEKSNTSSDLDTNSSPKKVKVEENEEEKHVFFF